MPIYETTGTLTGTIAPENIGLANDYLQDSDMADYLDEPLKGVVEYVVWRLRGDGHSYSVKALTLRELTADELTQLGDWVSGQNSDGLGEGFEQQPFAEIEPSYDYNSDLDDVEDGWGMISFDWETNKSEFVRVV